MKCLVTGGCGFIGSHIVDALIDDGHSVLALDDVSTGDRSRLAPSAELIEGSVADADLLRDATRGVDWLFHTAALARIPRSLADPVGTHLVNVDGSLNALEAARENGIRRVIISSSSSVYGEQDSPMMREDMTPNPASPYALQKRIAEMYADIYARAYGVSAVSLRYFNVYGPRQPSEGAYPLVIPKFMRMRERGERLTVYGDGEQTRAYTHVSDVVRANLLAASADLPPRAHTILNIGSSVETTVNELAAMIGGEEVEHVPNPRGEFEERRKSADYSRAENVIGWAPTVTLSEGIAALMSCGG